MAMMVPFSRSVVAMSGHGATVGRKEIHCWANLLNPLPITQDRLHATRRGFEPNRIQSPPALHCIQGTYCSVDFSLHLPPW